MRLALFLLFLAAPALAVPPAVGRLVIEGAAGRNLCSGTLTAPDRVVTAAHCLLAPDGARRAIARVTFLAGSDAAAHGASVEVTDWQVHPRAVGADGIDATHDIAVLVLARALEAEPLALAGPRAPGPFMLAGYPREAGGLAEVEGCAEVAAPRPTLDCRIADGMSGGPALTGDSPPRIAAILSGTTSRGTVVARIDGWTRQKAGARPYTP